MRKFEVVDKEFRKHPMVDIVLPQRATKNAAGYDFYSPEDKVIPAGKTEIIWTDVKATFGEREMLVLCVTSGMGKRGLMLANNIGVIESDYYNNESNNGNLGFRLYNFSDQDYYVKKGEKIGQGVFTTFLTVDNEEEVTTVRTGGFGSTDKKSVN